MKRIISAILTVSFCIMCIPQVSATSSKKGDVDLDGKISINDVTAIQQYLVGLSSFNAEQNGAADVNSDSKIDITDVSEIQKYISKMQNVIEPIQPTTQAPTQKPTQAPTQKPTQAPTQEPTEPPKPKALLSASSGADSSYKNVKYSLTNAERTELERIVTGEFGTDYIGSCLIAQCIRDALVYGKCSSPMSIRREFGYAGYNTNVTANARNAVKFIFDEGGMAVQHRILVMYNPTYCYSSWHESQHFIVAYGGVRFFDYWS